MADYISFCSLHSGCTSYLRIDTADFPPLLWSYPGTNYQLCLYQTPVVLFKFNRVVRSVAMPCDEFSIKSQPCDRWKSTCNTMLIGIFNCLVESMRFFIAVESISPDAQRIPGHRMRQIPETCRYGSNSGSELSEPG